MTIGEIKKEILKIQISLDSVDLDQKKVTFFGKNEPRPLKLLFFIQVIAFGAFYFTAPSPILTVINVFILELLDFAIVPPLQMNVVEVAEEIAPKAVNSASGLNIAAAILSIAFLMSVYEVHKNKNVSSIVTG